MAREIINESLPDLTQSLMLLPKLDKGHLVLRHNDPIQDPKTRHDIKLPDFIYDRINTRISEWDEVLTRHSQDLSKKENEGNSATNHQTDLMTRNLVKELFPALKQ